MSDGTPLPNRTAETPVTGRDYPDDDPSGRRWSEIWRTAIEELNANALVSDLATNRLDYEPEDGTLFVPSDGGDWYLGDGSSWNNLGAIGEIDDHLVDTSNPHSVTAAQADALPTSGGTVTGDTTFTTTTHDSIDTANADINSPHTTGSPLSVGPTGDGQALRLNTDTYDGSTNQHRAQILWDHPDETLGHIGFRPAESDAGKPMRFGVYTSTADPGNGGTRAHRFSITGSSEASQITARHLNRFQIMGYRGDFGGNPTSGTLDILRGSSDYNAELRFRTSDDSALSRVRHADFGNMFLETFETGSSLIFEPDDTVATNSPVDHRQNTSSGVVWESGTTSGRPGSPVEGQRYFDTDLGQPIWYDGTDWVDSQGTVV